MPKLTDAQKHQLREAIEKHQLTALATLLEEMAQSAVYMVTTEPDTYTQLGNTRIGGVPDLPSTLDWPKTERGYMVFVAQINLAELPHLEGNPLPSKGMLYFFISSLSAKKFSHRVLFFNGEISTLKKAEQPPLEQFEERPEWAIYFPCHVQMKVGISISYHDTYYAWELVAQKMSSPQKGSGQLIDKFQEEIRGFPRHHETDISHLFSYPTIFDDDPRLFAQMHRIGLYDNDDPITYDQVPKDEDLKQWHLLFEVASHIDAKMCWWDAGYLQFYIHEDELKQLDFSKTYATLITS